MQLNITTTTLAIAICAVMSQLNAQVHKDLATNLDSLTIQKGVQLKESSKVQEMLSNMNSYQKSHPQIAGYRVEIFSSSGANSKLKARNTRLKFTSEHDSIPAYVVWEYPNFEVRIGDYRTKLEAEQTLKAIQDKYPFAFITKDQIELPAID